jgi:hypothetical protein
MLCTIPEMNSETHPDFSKFRLVQRVGRADHVVLSGTAALHPVALILSPRFANSSKFLVGYIIWS